MEPSVQISFEVYLIPCLRHGKGEATSAFAADACEGSVMLQGEGTCYITKSATRRTESLRTPPTHPADVAALTAVATLASNCESGGVTNSFNCDVCVNCGLPPPASISCMSARTTSKLSCRK